MKLIDDRPIKPGDIIHMKSEIERYVMCHNAWVELYNMFVDIPTLSRFLDMAYGATRDEVDYSKITPDGFPKVFLMKVAIGIMAEYIENSEDAYAFTLEEVSKNHNIDKEMLDHVIGMNCGINKPSDSEYIAVVNECDGKPSSIKITFRGKDHILNINNSIYNDLLKLRILKKRELDETDKHDEDTVTYHKEPQGNLTSSRERHKVVTLCGSTRFKDEFMKVATDLTREGYIVLMPHVFSHSESEDNLNHSLNPDKLLNMNLANSLNSELLNIHLAKIDMSDEIFVINKDGYIGDGTKQEIKYASDHGKIIRFLCGEGIVDYE